MNQNDLCKRCGVGTLKPWSELTADERLVVERLPQSSDHSPAERERSHRWCTRCWHEEQSNQADA